MMLIDEWDYRVTDILEVVKEFTKESNYNLTYNQSNTLIYLMTIIQDPHSDILVEYRDGELAGVAILLSGPEFNEEWFGYINKLYVRPKFRGTTVGRTLFSNSCEWFDSKGCVYSFCSSTAGVDQDKQFSNLAAKYGFSDCGKTLVRKQQ